ncbi:uncharacterized protein TNCV_3023711 [Trichonephila clavipes]|nr:uncharacterized protein TNCV_3023711 [Trichonephila clavipes]
MKSTDKRKVGFGNKEEKGRHLSSVSIQAKRTLKGSFSCRIIIRQGRCRFSASGKSTDLGAGVEPAILGTEGGQGQTNYATQPASCQVIYSQFGLAIHQNDHQARRRFVEWAQNEIAVVPDFHKRILFSDEAHFWLNGYVNKQNCRIWNEANP